MRGKGLADGESGIIGIAIFDIIYAHGFNPIRFSNWRANFKPSLNSR